LLTFGLAQLGFILFEFAHLASIIKYPSSTIYFSNISLLVLAVQFEELSIFANPTRKSTDAYMVYIAFIAIFSSITYN
jgi:hypothetical protein